MIRPFTVFADQSEKKYMDTIAEHIQNNDFNSAALENDQRIKYYKNKVNLGDDVIDNYTKQVLITQALLARIISDENRIKELEKKNRELFTQFKKEVHDLSEQLDRLKQIDLKTNKL